MTWCQTGDKSLPKQMMNELIEIEKRINAKYKVSINKTSS